MRTMLQANMWVMYNHTDESYALVRDLPGEEWEVVKSGFSTVQEVKDYFKEMEEDNEE